MNVINMWGNENPRVTPEKKSVLGRSCSPRKKNFSYNFHSMSANKMAFLHENN